MSRMRIGGLSSGIDTDKIVSDLMKAQRIRIDSLKQKKQQMEWKKDDFHTVNSSLITLRSMVSNMKLQSTYIAKSATSSNETAVTATANPTASAGAYNVTVTQLAQGVTKGSQSALPEESNADGTIKTLASQFGIAGTISFTLEGKLVNGVRQSKDFSIDTSTYTINTLTNEISSAGLGITASYDSSTNRFYLTTTGTGTDNGIKVSSDPSSFLSDATGAGSGTLKLLTQTGTLYQGQSAQFNFGDTSNLTSQSNTATVNGINLTLKQGGGATSTITVSSDVNAVYNSIKSFIDQYNTTIGLVNSEMAEERYKDYLPLTDEQRGELSDSQESAWDAKAKSGMLKNDDLLSRAVKNIRSAMSGKVDGISSVTIGGQSIKHNTLASIGIITGLYSEGGKLYLEKDGATLKEAIQNDPDGVMKLFTNTSTVSGEKGIAVRLYDEVNRGVNDIIDKAGVQSISKLYDSSTLGKNLNSISKQINEWEDRLIKVEDRYWRQFTAMEKAISQMNSQSAWLSQQFNSK